MQYIASKFIQHTVMYCNARYNQSFQEFLRVTFSFKTKFSFFLNLHLLIATQTLQALHGILL